MVLGHRIKKSRKSKNQQEQDQSSPPNQQVDWNQVLETGVHDPKTVMQLQRTIGNQATQSLLQRQTNTIQRSFTVHDTNWKEAKTLDATSGRQGVTGVFFIKNKTGEQLVLKPSHKGARSVLATSIMKDVGVETGDVRNIALNSSEGKKLTKTIKGIIKAKKATTNATAKWSAFGGKGFDSMLVMQTMENLTTFATMTDKGGFDGEGDFVRLLNHMWSSAFWFDLGRIHAADMLMGNSDRLDRMNVKNIFVNMQTGGSVGLDIDLEAAGFESVTQSENPQNEEGKSIEGQEYKDWVTYAVEGMQGKRNYRDRNKEVQEGTTGARGGELGPSDTRLLTDKDRMGQKIDKMRTDMKGYFESENTDELRKRAQDWMNMDWDEAKTMFFQGIRQGMLVLNQKVESGAYDQQSKELTDQFGPDPQIEPIMFKLRNMYYQQMQNDPDVKETDLRQKLEIYAEWLHTGKGFNPFAQENIRQPRGREHRRAIPLGMNINF